MFDCVIYLVIVLGIWLRVASLYYFLALRELFRAKLGNSPASNFSSGELMRSNGLSQSVKEEIKADMESVGETSRSLDSTEEPQKSPRRRTSSGRSFLQLNDPADEFFDFPDEEYDQHETMWPSDSVMHSQVNYLS